MRSPSTRRRTRSSRRHATQLKARRLSRVPRSPRFSSCAWRRRHGTSGQERGVLKVLAPAVDALRSNQRELRIATAAVAVLLTIDAISLAVLELFEARGETSSRRSTRATVVINRTVVARRAHRGRRCNAGAVHRRPRVLAFVWLGVTALKVAAYDGTQLGGWTYFVALITLASVLLLAGYLRDVLDEASTLSLETAIAVAMSIAFAVGSLRPLESRHDWGFALLAIGVVLAHSRPPSSGPQAARSLHVAVAPALGIGAVTAFSSSTARGSRWCGPAAAAALGASP